MIGKASIGKRAAIDCGRRWCGWAIACLSILFGATAGARAQGVRYDNIVLGPRGTPVGAATIAVCAAGAATSATPCSPLATIYSDEALTLPMANPMQADALGNYGFWAAPGHYVVQIYSAGVTTKVMDVFLPCDPSNCSMSNATFSSITAGTLNLTGGLTVNGRSVATQPLASDAVMYVSPNGNDSSDGLSWGTAKQTLYAAVQAISGPPNSGGGGTIYIAAGAACGGPVNGQGLWLYRTGSSPGNGWLPINAMTFIGVGTDAWGNNGPAPVVVLNCGSATQPGLQLDNINAPLKFENLAFGGSIGANLIGGVTTVTFDNVVFSANDSNATNGPAVFIGPASFWLYFRHCVFQANDNAGKATDGSDATEAFVINVPSGQPNSSLIFVDQSVARNGDIKFNNPGNAEASLFVDGLTTENQTDGRGAVWFPTTSGSTQVSLRDIGVADATVNPTPAVEVDSGVPNAILVSGATGNGFNTTGPMKVLSQYPNNVQNETQTPLQKGQEGIIEGRLWAQDDDARRLFGPVASRFANPVPYSGTGGGWSTSSGSPNPVLGSAAPDGTNNAVQITGGSSGSGLQWTESEASANNGDYLIGGVWIRNATGSGGSPPLDINTGCAAVPVPLTPASIGYPATGLGTQEGVSGEWEWVSYAYKLSSLSGPTACYPGFTIQAGANQTMQFYAPVFYYVPSGTITDAEAAWIGITLAPYPDSISPPIESTLRGHPIAFGGSGDNYFATLDHTALTANQTYDFPNQSGTIALAGANGVSAGSVALSAGAASHTFAAAYGAAPVCALGPSLTGNTYKVTATTTGLTITSSSPADTSTVSWVCTPAVN